MTSTSGWLQRYAKIALLASVCVLLLLPSAAHAAFTWSLPAEIAPGPHGFNTRAIACPSSTQCTAIDSAGQEVTFDAQSPGSTAAVTVESVQLNGVACPSARQCTAVGARGVEVTFDPLSPGTRRSAAVGEGSLGDLTAIACPSTSQCTAVGQEEEVTFDPSAPESASRTHIGAFVYSIACPSSTQCTAAGYGGFEVTFDPTAPGSPAATQIESHTLEDIACPTLRQCTAVSNISDNTRFHERSEGQEVTFDPTAARAKTPRTIFNRGSALDSHLEALACTSPTRCVAVGEQGYAVAFNPRRPVLTALATQVDGTDHPAHLRSIVCPAGTQCTTITDEGHELTFDPASPGAPESILIDSYRSLASVACPSSEQCTAVGEGGGESTFDPASPAGASQAHVYGGGALASVACPSSEQCTAVGEGGGEVTFDPSSPAGAASSAIDVGRDLRGVACPTISQCTAVDDDGFEVTFDPASPGGASRSAIGHEAVSNDEGTSRGYASIACRGVAQCTAVGDRVPRVKYWSTQVVTFDPGSPVTSELAETFTPLSSVACPSDEQCTAVGRGERTAGGEQVTFDPAPLEPLVPEEVPGILWPGTLTSIACPSAELCVAVDSTGRVTST